MFLWQKGIVLKLKDSCIPKLFWHFLRERDRDRERVEEIHNSLVMHMISLAIRSQLINHRLIYNAWYEKNDHHFGYFVRKKLFFSLL